jgi:predicted nuclease with RNAse H fold
MRIVGIDLAGSEKRATGFCIMDRSLGCETRVLCNNKEVIEAVIAARPDIVSIDAPLSLPKGRKTIEDRSGPHFRECDRELLKMKIKFFPITLGPMRMLTTRGILLRKRLERAGLTVIESFPGAAQDILGIPRKQRGLEKLRKGLINYGIKGKDIRRAAITDHELDAITCAITGKMFLEKDYVALGAENEGLLIIPRPSST